METDPYAELARGEAADRRRLRWASGVALVLHLALLVLPLPGDGGGPEVRLPPVAAQPFLLREVRFAPPPVDPVPVEPDPEPSVTVPESTLPPDPPPEGPTRPPTASAEVLVPVGAAGTLVPPQPLSTPPPPYPEELWSEEADAEVVLTVVVDDTGRVVDVAVEEGPAPLGELAARTVRGWVFLPASYGGNPMTTAVRVRVSFPKAGGGGGEPRGADPVTPSIPGGGATPGAGATALPPP